jgi:hypothetical protein
MDGLAIVAMANVLRHRFAGQLHFDDTATTSDMGSCHLDFRHVPMETRADE